jgi:Zn-finger nucleic acid-binding protein
VNCPKCTQPLERRPEDHFKNIYTCAVGHGLAIGFVAFKQDFESGPFTRLWVQARIDPTPTSCPGCRNPMRRSEMGVGQNQVTLDLCKVCHLVWFDPGELQAIRALKASHPEVFIQKKQERALAAAAFGQAPIVVDPQTQAGSLGVAAEQTGMAIEVLDVLSLFGELFIDV